MDLFGLDQYNNLSPQASQMAQLINQQPNSPYQPLHPRPSTKVLLERKERMLRFWRPRNIRMLEDERIYKMINPVEDRIGGDELGGSETLVLNDPYVLIEKLANMIAANDPVIEMPVQDPGLKSVAQKVKDFLYWWREEADSRWMNNLNNTLSRDEIYYLALRGWLAGRVMLDPTDQDFPWRFDLIDPIHVYPQKGPKGIRWVFHAYRDSKINVVNDMGWSQDLLDRIEEKLANVDNRASVQVASYYDDCWHVLFINDEEVWSAPHNYGFVPWVINISFGPPIRRTDPASSYAGTYTSTSPGLLQGAALNQSLDYPRYWGVSAFHGIKDIYGKTNKLASAILTEAMKAPNPPVIVTTDASGVAEGKEVDTSIGAVTYARGDRGEKIEPLQYGFNPNELTPLLTMLQDAKNRGTLPSVMYGEGATYLSGFAVNLLQTGARDLLLPLIKAHENFLRNIFKDVLTVTAEIYPYPVKMIETDPDTGSRSLMSEITGDEIKAVGYSPKVYYRNVGPQDKQQMAQIAAQLVSQKIISLDTARGDEFLGLKNPILENKKVIADLAYFDPDVVKAAIPAALAEVDPTLYVLYMNTMWEKQQMQMQQMMMMMNGPPGKDGNGSPNNTGAAPMSNGPSSPGPSMGMPPGNQPQTMNR